MSTKKKNKKNGKKSTKKSSFKSWVITGSIALGLGFAYQMYNKLDVLNMPSTEVSISKGATLFGANCASCHGEKAVGENVSRPQGGTRSDDSYIAPALNGNGHAWHHPTRSLFDTIKNGSMEPTSPMRAFEERLSDKEIMMTIHYFKSLWSPKIRVAHAQRTKGR